MREINIFTFTLLSLFLTSSSYAAERYDTKAFRTITKLCASCHGTPFYQAKQNDDDDWEYYFETKGKLAKIHKGNTKGMGAVSSPLFKKNKKRILKLFIENSKYSGAVNGCDANFCGTNH